MPHLFFIPSFGYSADSSFDAESMQWAVPVHDGCGMTVGIEGKLLCENFYVLGFSTAGSVALLKKVNRSSCDCQPFHYMVMNLERNEFLADIDMSTPYYRNKPLMEWVTEFNARFSIVPESSLVVQAFPSVSQDDSLRVVLEHPHTNSCRLMLSSRRHGDSLLAEANNRSLMNCDSVIGYIANSPHSSWLVILEGKRSLSGKDQEIFYSFFGVSLK